MTSVSSYRIISREDLYIDDPVSIEKREQKLATVSWVSQIEEELGDRLTEEPLSCSTENSSERETESLSDSLDEESDLGLLGSLLAVMTSVKKTVKQYLDRQVSNTDSASFKFDDCIESLEWAENVADRLSNKLKLPKIQHTAPNKHSAVARSSYKFCDFGTDCHYNYDHKKFDGCFAQHFAYNYLRADISALLNYIETNRTRRVKFIEVLTCMNTICYVVNHMKDEYSGILVYYPENIDDMHQERTPSDTKRKRRVKTKN